MNWAIFLIATGFFLFQNRHFGWNERPRSDNELLADGITFLLFALAFL